MMTMTIMMMKNQHTIGEVVPPQIVRGHAGLESESDRPDQFQLLIVVHVSLPRQDFHDWHTGWTVLVMRYDADACHQNQRIAVQVNDGNQA